MAMRRYWLTVALAAFAVYSMIAVFGTLSSAVYFADAHVAVNWTSFVANKFLEQWTCALFVPVLFWLVARFPITRQSWLRNTPILLGAAFACTVAKYAIMNPLYRLWAGRPTDPLWLTVVENALPVMFDFAAAMGVAHAIWYYRDAKERERVAAALETQLVQSRLDALRGQLQPHFLFNTLNAVATLMHEDVDTADRMLTRLADLLRMSLERSAQEISLAEELDLARVYLAIMESRFSDRLTVDVSVDAEAYSALVPTFLLQPLLENALEHGIARRRGPGRIAIAAQRTNGRVEITVLDDGPGPAGEPGPGIGLANTRARLEELYDGNHRLALEPAPGGGARVTVSIPYRECTAS
jgi:LytS/YehU family sensor histidine kinase